MTQTETTTNAPSRAFRNPLDIPILALSRRFGSKSKEVERFLKFAVVGTIGAIVDSGTLILLQATILPPTTHLNVAVASTIAFVAAIASNFTWNRLWTYPDSRSRTIRRQMTQFAVVSAIGWLARTVWITSAFRPLGAMFMPIFLSVMSLARPHYVPSAAAQDKLGTMVAWVIGVIVVMIWNFFANRYWTYNDVD